MRVCARACLSLSIVDKVLRSRTGLLRSLPATVHCPCERVPARMGADLCLQGIKSAEVVAVVDGCARQGASTGMPRHAAMVTAVAAAAAGAAAVVETAMAELQEKTVHTMARLRAASQASWDGAAGRRCLSRPGLTVAAPFDAHASCLCCGRTGLDSDRQLLFELTAAAVVAHTVVLCCGQFRAGGRGRGERNEPPGGPGGLLAQQQEVPEDVNIGDNDDDDGDCDHAQQPASGGDGGGLHAEHSIGAWAR